MKIINPIYTDTSYLNTLREEFHKNPKVKHIILDNFLEKDFYNRILSEIHENKHTTIGDKDGRKICYIKGAAMKELYALYSSLYMKKFISYMFYREVHLELHTGGNNFIPEWLVPHIYRKGCFIRKSIPGSHLDWHTDGPSSIIGGSFLLYLNENWSKEDGGELHLGEEDVSGKIVGYKKVTPIGNRLVFLRCEENISWHKVEPIYKERMFLHDQVLISA